ncbi:unnamed protein product [Amoebophrya sp. A120]|nr:unnamed protein product [Amoebophrya sp. A120]|eukprot:GSA120T00013971001.1
MLSSASNFKRHPRVVTAALAVVADVVSFQQHVLQSSAVALSSSSSSTLVRIKTSMSSRKGVVPAAGPSIRGSRRTTRKTPPSLLQRYFYAKMRHHSSSLLPRTSRGPHDFYEKMTSTPGQFLSVKEKNYSKGQKMTSTTLLSTSDSFPGTKASDESTKEVQYAVASSGKFSRCTTLQWDDPSAVPACAEEARDDFKILLAEQAGFGIVDIQGMVDKIATLVDARIVQCSYTCNHSATFGNGGANSERQDEINAYVLAVNDVALLLDEAKQALTPVAAPPPATLALFAELTAKELFGMKDEDEDTLTTKVTNALTAIVGQKYTADEVEITADIVAAVDTNAIVAAVMADDADEASIQKAITDAVTKAIDDAAGAGSTFQKTASDESTKTVQDAIDNLATDANTSNAIAEAIKSALTTAGVEADAVTAADAEIQNLAALVADSNTKGDDYAKAVDALALLVDEAKKAAADATTDAPVNDTDVNATTTAAPAADAPSC